MSDVLASVFVAAEYRDAARAEISAQLSTEGVSYDTSGFFSAELSETGDAPTTHYMSSGYWHANELEALVNGVTPRVVKFGDVQAAMISLGLRPVVPVEPEPMQGNEA